MAALTDTEKIKAATEVYIDGLNTVQRQRIRYNHEDIVDIAEEIDRMAVAGQLTDSTPAIHRLK